MNGLTMHLYSLRSERNWGIGDFTDLLNLMKYAAENKLDFVGINPLHALFTSKPAFASPYSPSSRDGSIRFIWILRKSVRLLITSN